MRLAALRNHPEAFGADCQEEAAADLSRLIGAGRSATFGAFQDKHLIGIAGLVVPERIKQRHRGQVVSVYVVPDHRRDGVAAALVDALIVHARAAGLLVLTLSVTVGNAAARALYLKAGFQPYGVEPAALAVDGRLLDEELLAKRLD